MMDAVREDVKFNCDVSDAKYWGFFSVCGLLMRLRDLFRSESNLRPWSTIEKEKISSWIAAKESAWPALEKEEFRDLSIGGRTFDPFDVSGINTALNEEGLSTEPGTDCTRNPLFFWLIFIPCGDCTISRYTRERANMSVTSSHLRQCSRDGVSF